MTMDSQNTSSAEPKPPLPPLRESHRHQDINNSAQSRTPSRPTSFRSRTSSRPTSFRSQTPSRPTSFKGSPLPAIPKSVCSQPEATCRDLSVTGRDTNSRIPRLNERSLVPSPPRDARPNLGQLAAKYRFHRQIGTSTWRDRAVGAVVVKEENTSVARARSQDAPSPMTLNKYDVLPPVKPRKDTAGTRIPRPTPQNTKSHVIQVPTKSFPDDEISLNRKLITSLSAMKDLLADVTYERRHDLCSERPTSLDDLLLRSVSLNCLVFRQVDILSTGGESDLLSLLEELDELVKCLQTHYRKIRHCEDQLTNSFTKCQIQRLEPKIGENGLLLLFLHDIDRILLKCDMKKDVLDIHRVYQQLNTPSVTNSKDEKYARNETIQSNNSDKLTKHNTSLISVSS